MISQLYLWDRLRELYKNQIQLFVDTFNKKIPPLYENIEEEAEQLGNDLFNGCSDPYADPADTAEYAVEMQVEYYQNMSLMRYNSIAMWISTLYQYWEQQVRMLLFKEMERYWDIEIEGFCTTIEQIKKCFKIHGVDIEEYESWEKLNELRLLCNAIKHGIGGSANKLMELNPDLFVSFPDSNDKLLNLYSVTLHNQVLNISEELFNSYAENLIAFWDELPERAYESVDA